VDATLNGNDMYETLSVFHASGGNIVTTGGVVQQLFDTSGNSRIFLDNITPLSVQSGGVSIGSAITLNGTPHPITDDIGNINTGFTNWYTSVNNDAGATQLAYGTGGNTLDHAISFTEGTGGAGNIAFVGGGYLNSALDTTSLRNGDADFVLEQALAWATGVPKEILNENVPFTFTHAGLMKNDFDPDFTGQITAVSAFSANGATIRIDTVNDTVTFDPTSSIQLNALNDGETTTDTFTYTFENGAGTASDTATVTLTINGVTDTDNLPELAAVNEMNGFASGGSNFYRFGARVTDADEATGITYILHDGTDPVEMATGVTFSGVFVDFSFTAAAQTNYTDGIGVYAYEADGQAVYVDVGYSVEVTGDLRFFYSDFAPANGGPVLEIAFDDDAGFTGEDTVGTGQLVDLSGIDALAPDVVDNMAVLDLRNGQENSITIDTAALLQMINGNAVGDTENFIIQMDSYDNYTFNDDAVSAVDWSADLASGTTYNLTDTTAGTAGTAGTFGLIGDIFAVLDIDGGVQV